MYKHCAYQVLKEEKINKTKFHINVLGDNELKIIMQNETEMYTISCSWSCLGMIRSRNQDTQIAESW